MGENNNLNISRDDRIEQSVIKLMKIQCLSREDAEAAMQIAEESRKGEVVPVGVLYDIALALTRTF